MNKSKVTLLGSVLIASSVVTLAYAGFTEINSSGDIISKDNASSVRTSFSSPDHNIQTPLRTYSLWDKISETTKYNATIKDKNTNITPVAIEQTNSYAPSAIPTYKNTTNNSIKTLDSKAELTKALELLKKSEEANLQLKYDNLELQVKVIEMNKDISELQKQVNFLASQMEQVESDVLVMKTKKTGGFLARN